MWNTTLHIILDYQNQFCHTLHEADPILKTSFSRGDRHLDKTKLENMKHVAIKTTNNSVLEVSRSNQEMRAWIENNGSCILQFLVLAGK